MDRSHKRQSTARRPQSLLAMRGQPWADPAFSRHLNSFTMYRPSNIPPAQPDSNHHIHHRARITGQHGRQIGRAQTTGEHVRVHRAEIDAVGKGAAVEQLRRLQGGAANQPGNYWLHAGSAKQRATKEPREPMPAAAVEKFSKPTLSATPWEISQRPALQTS